MFNLFKKTAKFFGKGFLYSIAFAFCPLILIGYLCCSDEARRGSHGTGTLLQCCGVLCALPCVILTALTLPLGLAAAAVLLAAGIVVCPLAAVGDCIMAGANGCSGGRGAAVPHAVHQHPAFPRHDIENPPVGDPLDISYANAYLPSSHAAIRSTLQHEQKANEDHATPLDAFSRYTQDYVDNFNDKKSHTATIAAMKLTEEEVKLMEKHLDPITGEVMDIPVMLNEKVYNLLTLQEILARDRKDPFNRVEFTLRDIQPARGIEEEINNTLRQIEENRKKTKAIPAKSPSRSNSGSSLNLTPRPAI